MVAKRQDLVVEQGRTFTRVIRWETTPLIWKPISAIGQVAPALITAAGHGLTDGWKVAISDVVGMLQINAKHTPLKDSDFQPCTYISASQIALNAVSAAGYDAYVSGGYVVFYTPVDMTGFTAAMTIKDRIGGAVLQTFTGAQLVIDNVGKTITFSVGSELTAAYTWIKGVYDLEMVSPSGIITAILSGNITVVDEVTT